MISRNVIINVASEVGFDLVGVVRSEPLVDERKRFVSWLLAGNASTLSYLGRNVEKRFDASLLVEGSRSVIVCAISYLSPYSRGYAAGCRTKVASYALNRDYHLTIKSMLTELGERLREHYQQLRFRAFTDSAPMAEKSYARRAGIGWIGRQSLVINPKYGSMMHLGELVVDDDVDEYDTPLRGVGCGSCHACVDACPNGAIRDDRMIDTRKCISCRTIEREGVGHVDLDGWIFGCDVCQTCCPFNQHAPLHRNPKFDHILSPEQLTLEQLTQMTDDEFQTIAGDTPLMRAGLDRLRRNALCNSLSTEDEQRGN